MNYLLIPEAVWLALAWLPLALAALGGILLAQGIWGARHGWEPRCRRCAHDLRGLAHDVRACPECGADLTRANAVHAGRRRVRGLRVALAVLVVAGAAVGQSLLGNGGVTRLRANLVARMPVEELVFEVVSRGPNAALAEATLLQQLMDGARLMPSGALLDALLAAGRRYEEAGLGAMAAGLGNAPALVARLDDAERTRLAELAADELLESRGARRGLLDLAMRVVRWQPPTQVDVREAVLERLARTPEGRALLLPEPSIRSAESGDRIVVEFRSLLDASGGMPRLARGGRGATGASDELARLVVVEGAEFRPDDPSQPSVELFPLPADGASSLRGGQTVALLADAPAGKGTLVVRGLTVPQSKVRVRDGFGPGIDLARARTMAGAQPYERTVEIEIAPPVARPMDLATDASAVEAMRTELSRSEIRPSAGFGSSIALGTDSLMLSAEASYAFEVALEREGRPRTRIGTVEGQRGGRSTSGCTLPEDLDPQQPFRIVLTPSFAAAVDRRDTMPILWSRFDLSFANLDAAPVVTASPLPDRSDTILTLLSGPAVEARLATLAALLPPAAVDARGGSVLEIRPRPRWNPSDDDLHAGDAPDDPASETDTFDDLSFSGTFEARIDGRLAAPTRRWIGPLAEPLTVGLELRLVAAPTGGGPIVVRYRPDPSLCPADPSGEFRFVSVPFELRYETPDAAPSLRLIREE